MKTNFCLALLLFLILGCKKNSDNSNTVRTESKSAVLMDVAYDNDDRQKMDLYLPANRNTQDTKLLILIHGGGWVGGDKSDLNNYVSGLQSRLPGYAIANVNYRLASGSENLFPTQEMDIKKAVEVLLSKYNDYVFSKKYVLLGASAGGHLALLNAYKYESPEKAKAVISFYGPTDLVTLYNTSGSPTALSSTLGGTPSSNPSIYEQSSPITFVSNQSCPTFLLHGGIDIVVPPEQATILDNKLQASNVPHLLQIYPNDGHGWIGDDLTDSFNRIATFLNEHVQ